VDYSTGSFQKAARKLTEFNLDLVGGREVRMEEDGLVSAEDMTLSHGNGNERDVFPYVKE
jgi:hypothetical protein